MPDFVNKIQAEIYNRCLFKITNFNLESESAEYDACRFRLNGLHVLSRTAKITPKKVGQFVTFWKRSTDRTIKPFDDTDQIDFYVINVQTETTSGQFVFPRSVLIKKGIISTINKEGKRAFRVYPTWDTPQSKQALQTQKWQSDYFCETGNAIDTEKMLQLYNTV